MPPLDLAIPPTYMSSTVPAMPELIAPAHWRTVEFISDLHLDPDEPATVQAWRDYLSSSQADAIFLLGDIFEVWVGDDALLEADSFEAKCAQTLSTASARRSCFYIYPRWLLAGPEQERFGLHGPGAHAGWGHGGRA